MQETSKTKNEYYEPDIENNKVTIMGTIVSGFDFSHEIRSYNRHEEHKNKLVLSVFAKEIEFVKEISEHIVTNQIFLKGYVCKEPLYRKTPLGREMTELLLAVNRPYGKSDYIPCVCWGRNARYVSDMAIGEQCLVWGSILSRKYMKELEKQIAYEVAISRLERPQYDE